MHDDAGAFEAVAAMSVTRSAIDEAAHLLGPLAVRDHPIARATTYRVGGNAALFVNCGSTADLLRVAEVRRCTGVPVVVVGRGSNMLVADTGFDGIAVSILELGAEIGISDADPAGAVEVTAGGGVSLPVLARRTAAAGVIGFEWAVGVPGSIGGAVRMNAGGHGSDMAASLVNVDIVDLDAAHGESPLATRGVGELGLRFRGSALDDRHVVLRARLGLRAGDRAAAERELAEIVRWRREHQPGGQNCGSVFVNPVPGELSAGELIDRCGLRGLRIGTAQVSPKHANFIQADEDGTADDVCRVMSEVRRRVADETGHVLRSEVRLVGFPEDAT